MACSLISVRLPCRRLSSFESSPSREADHSPGKPRGPDSIRPDIRRGRRIVSPGSDADACQPDPGRALFGRTPRAVRRNARRRAEGVPRGAPGTAAPPAPARKRQGPRPLLRDPCGGQPRDEHDLPRGRMAPQQLSHRGRADPGDPRGPPRGFLSRAAEAGDRPARRLSPRLRPRLGLRRAHRQPRGAETLARFVRAYQRVQPLTIGELWALAISLRLVLVENLRRLSERVAARGVEPRTGRCHRRRASRNWRRPEGGRRLRARAARRAPLREGLRRPARPEAPGPGSGRHARPRVARPALRRKRERRPTRWFASSTRRRSRRTRRCATSSPACASCRRRTGRTSSRASAWSTRRSAKAPGSRRWISRPGTGIGAPSKSFRGKAVTTSSRSPGAPSGWRRRRGRPGRPRRRPTAPARSRVLPHLEGPRAAREGPRGPAADAPVAAPRLVPGRDRRSISPESGSRPPRFSPCLSSSRRVRAPPPAFLVLLGLLALVPASDLAIALINRYVTGWSARGVSRSSSSPKAFPPSRAPSWSFRCF